jgi:hypothetical protein
MVCARTMKKRVGGRPPGLSGLTINTGSYKIATTLSRKEIDSMIDELRGIEGRNVEAYKHVAQIAEKLLAKDKAITLEADKFELEHAAGFAKDAAKANNDKREKYSRTENIANLIINVLEKIRENMTGGKRTISKTRKHKKTHKRH